jgi:UDP-glucose 4-epimerase
MNLKGKRILLTGATGFVGSHLSQELRRQEAEVLALTDETGFRIDVRDWPRIRAFGNEHGEIDLVYHLAALMFVPQSFDNPRDIYEVNVLGTLNILELCRLCSIPKIIFASSYVYGQPHYLPIDEEHPPNPQSPYARSKLLGEVLCKSYHDDYGISCAVLRVFNLYGEGQQGSLLIASILEQLRTGEIVLRDPEPKRDYLYVGDAIDAYVKAGQYARTTFEVLNIGSGRSYSVRDIAARIVQAWGKETNVNYLYQQRRADVADVVADIRKASDLLTWQPRVSFEEGIQRCVRQYKIQHKPGQQWASSA